MRVVLAHGSSRRPGILGGVELSEFDRPHRLVSRTTSSMMQTSGVLTFAADGDGTVMSWNWQVRPKGWMRMLGPLFGLLGGRMERRIWTSMKWYLENTAARPVPSAHISPVATGLAECARRKRPGPAARSRPPRPGDRRATGR